MADLRFDFTSTGADRLAAGQRKVADTSTLAARGARLLTDALIKQGAAAKETQRADRTLAEAAGLLAEVDAELRDKSLETAAAMRRQGESAQAAARRTAEAGASADAAGTGFAAMQSPMAAAVAAGVALAPVAVTVGTGLAGLGAAAASTISPVIKAAGSGKEAAKAFAGLDPAQRSALASLKGLKAEFGGFAKALEPVNLGLFRDAMSIASHAMTDVQPVARATGIALGGVLRQVDAELQGQQFQQFFAWMARQAGPDVKLLGNVVTGLLADIPPLTRDLQPLAVELLHGADNTAVLLGKLAQLAGVAENVNGRLVRSADGTEHWRQATSGLGGAVANAWHELSGHLSPGLDKLAPVTQRVWDKITGTSGATRHLTGSTANLAQTVLAIQKPVLDYSSLLAGARTALDRLLAPQLAWNNNLIGAYNDLGTMNTRLRASHGEVGLLTQAQRDAFGAANTYIGDLSQIAGQALSSHRNIGQAMAAIRAGFPTLDKAAEHNAALRSELAQLHAAYDGLRLAASISKIIKVTASGVAYSNIPSVQKALHDSRLAAGGPVTMGTGPTADDVPIMASRGEYVIRASSVAKYGRAVMDAINAGRFAAGGPVPFKGSPAGLAGWMPKAAAVIGAGEAQALGTAMAHVLKPLLSTALAKAEARGTITGFMGDSGARTGSVAAEQRYAASLFRQYGWPQAMMPALAALWNRESGWNPWAVNPSSGAYGIPQALGHGHVFNLGDYQNQIIWGLNYIRGRYGNPLAAWMHEVAYGWYGKGGPVRGYQDGGFAGAEAPGGALRRFQAQTHAALDLFQAREVADYLGMAAAFRRIRRPGVWVTRELTALGALQGRESAAFQSALSGGLTAPGLAGLAAAAAAESGLLRRSGALRALHPGWVGAVGWWLDALAGGSAQGLAGLAQQFRTYAAGSWNVPRTGPAVVHQGEMILPARVAAAVRGGPGVIHVHIENHGVLGSQAELENWFVRTLDRAARQGKLAYALRRSPSA